jgi:N-acetylglucosamine malate deacetylase 1
MTNGVGSRSENKIFINERKKASQSVRNLLGINEIFQFDYPDNEMDRVSLIEVVKDIENICNKIRPTIVLTHFDGDLNIDHQIVQRATLTACRPGPKSKVRMILGFEVLSSTEWAFSNATRFNPNYYVDITGHINTKVEALSIYKMEMRDSPNSISIYNSKNLAAFRGNTVCVDFAEAFMCYRILE